MNDRSSIVGKRFGRLVVLARHGTLHRSSTWRCACDCGGTVVVRRQNLVCGYTSSCGCLRIESARTNGRSEASRRAAAAQAAARAAQANREQVKRSALDDLEAAWSR